MRILILNWRSPYDPKAGGAEKVTMKHAAYWIERGHSVTWLHAPPHVSSDAITYVALGNSLFVYLLAPLWYFFQKQKFDVVIDEIHALAWLTPWWCRAKKIVYIHEVAQNIWDDMAPWPLSVVGKWWEKFYLRYVYTSTQIVTVSESTKNDLVSFGIAEKNISVVPNGIEQAQKKGIGKNNNLTLVFVGRLVKMKGIEDALKVVHAIKKQVPQILLHVIGRGEEGYVAKLKQIIIEYGIQENVVFHGFVTNEKKDELIGTSHFLIHPSSREGFGLVVLETNALGTPAIGYNVAGLCDVIHPGVNGYLVEKGNTEAMAQKIIDEFKNQENYAKLQSTSREEVKKYSWDKSLKQFYLLVSGK